jgi:hypothetical protein
VGNNGASYNQALNCVNNYSVPYGVCSTLRNASDHLPVTLQLLVGGNSAVQAPVRTDLNFKVMGNPVMGNSAVLYCLETRDAAYSWHLSDVAGKILTQGQLKLAPNQRFEIPMEHLEAGIYLLSVQSSDGRVHTFRLMRG